MNLTMVTDDKIVAVASVDLIGGETAEDHIVAGAGADNVNRPHCRLLAVNGDQHAGMERHRALVAQHDVVAVAGDNRIGAEATENEVVATAGDDEIITADEVIERSCGAEVTSFKVEVAVIAKHQVAARAGIDVIRTRAAEDHVIARTRADDVGRTFRRRQALHEIEPGNGLDDLPMITEDNVVTFTGIDGVGIQTADDQVVTGTGGDGVGAAAGEIAGKHRVGAPGAEGDAAVVAEDNGEAVARGDDIAAVAAQNPMGAIARGDGVAGTGLRIDRGHVDQGRAVHIDLALIAEDDVGAAKCRDGIGTEPADDQVVAGTGGNDIVGTRAGDGDNAGQDARRKGDRAVIAEDNIDATAGLDDIVRAAARDIIRAGAGRDAIGIGTGVGLHDAEKEADGFDATFVAEDDVVAIARHDGVATRTTDDQVATSPGCDHIVTADTESR